MLSYNLWVQVGLLDGALRVVMQITHTHESQPPNLSPCVVVSFNTYNGP